MTGSLAFEHYYQPPQAAGAPTLLLLHGTGGDEHDLVPLGQSLLPGAGILSPRGKVLEGTAPRFFRRLAEGVFDLDDLRRRTSELADFVAASAAHYQFDVGRVIGVGFSNGANIAASILLSRPDLLQSAVLFRAMVPFVPDPLPSIPRTRVFLACGRHDRMIPAKETERLARLLTSAGADVTLAWEDAGHNLTPEGIEAATEWLRG